ASGAALSGSTINGTTPLTVAAGRTVTFQPGGSTVNAPLAVNGTLVVRATSTLNGPVTTGDGATVRVQGNSTAGAVNLATVGFVNKGLVELSSTDAAGFAATLSVNSGTLTNAAGRTVSALPGTGGARTLNGRVNNYGTVSLGAPLTWNNVGDSLNAGTLDLSL